MSEARGYHPPSKTTEYETPHDLFDRLWDQYGPVTLDPCGQHEVHYSAYRVTSTGGKCYDGSTEALDGLKQPWSGVVFMNPPYGRGIGEWLEKAVFEITLGSQSRMMSEITPGGWALRRGGPTRIVALLPAKTDTRWWHRYIQGRAHVEFLRGRLTFHGQPGAAPFPSAVVVWGDMP